MTTLKPDASKIALWFSQLGSLIATREFGSTRRSRSAPIRNLLAAAHTLKGVPVTTISRRMGKSGANDLWRAIRRRSGVEELVVTKGSTLAEWAGRQGYARTEVMAIGDNLNDLEMLEAAGLPVVMSNAVPALLERGWHVTASNDDAGVAQAIHRFVLRG